MSLFQPLFSHWSSLSSRLSNRLSNKKRWPVLIVCASFSLGLLWSLTHKAHADVAGGASTSASVSASTKAPANPGKVTPALTVTSVRAELRNWPGSISTSGNITAWQESLIGAQVAGLRLIELNAQVGDVVKRGQVLARFDADLLQTELAQLTASFEQADANKNRALRLKGTGSVSEQEILNSVTLAATSGAQLAAKRLQVAYAQVRAPDDGVISARSATLGSVAQNGQELFRLIRHNRLEWRGEATAPQLAQISVGQPVRLLLPDGKSAQAKVRQIAPSFDAQTRLALVYADIVPGSSARAGMYAQGELALAERQALVLPAASVILRDGRPQVLLLQSDNKVKVQRVQVGRRQGNQVELLQGIAAGQSVVLQGAGLLNDGDTVLVAGGKP
jgi:RND family efflux transporter MFP subunit